jgi:DNA-binding IclR family transcriptional regulator
MPASEVRVREVPAARRAIAILRLLGASDEPLGVNAIARALGLVPSTCLHILRVLVDEELAAFEPAAKRYSLNAGVLTLAQSFLGRSGFAELAQPALDRLSARHGVAAIGVQVIGLEHMVVVAISRAELTLRLHVELGSRFPALISATGRCLAAFGGRPQKELEARFRKLRWDRPPTLAVWRREVEAARVNGYSLDDGNYIAGVSIVAAPVLDAAGAMSHALVAVGLREQVARAGVEALAGELRRAAATLSERLSGPAASGRSRRAARRRTG